MLDLDGLLLTDPSTALRAAQGLLGLAETDPQARALAWRLVIDIARQEAWAEAARHHWSECVGCAWCTLGVPEPFTMGMVNDQTTSSLRSEG